MNHNTFRTMVAGGFAAASLTAAVAVGALASPAAAVAVGALASPVAAVTATSQPDGSDAPRAASPQGFIMSDGRICNPRWGC